MVKFNSKKSDEGTMSPRQCQDEVELTSISRELQLMKDIIAKRGLDIALDRRRIMKLEEMVQELVRQVENFVEKPDFEQCKAQIDDTLSYILSDITDINRKLDELSETAQAAYEVSDSTAKDLGELGNTIYREIGEATAGGNEAFTEVIKLKEIIEKQERRIKALEKFIAEFHEV